ncbi:MAG: carboxypeptidase-like regulatory domain-containing protein [Chitinophagaceae bacterium]|nr:carboxypeptidase-like regulatory domain-containing protein [Chitinophagaceae bacterium]
MLLAVKPATAQWFKIKGSVYDSSRNYPIELVTVMSSSGKGAITDADGHYEIEVMERDSIWFSYLNKPTMKFPVLKIANPFAFDISLQVNVTTLKEVKVRPRNYRQDSAQNRQDYAKVFNFQKPRLSPSVTNMGVGFDLNEIINMFRFRKNRSMLAFQQRLLAQEEEKAVDHRFSKALVRRLTGLVDRELDSFMLVFRPSYQFTLYTSDYDFQQYIKDSYRRYLVGLPPLPMLRQEEEEEQ